MADEEKSGRLPAAALAAIITGVFGLLTIVLTQWKSMPWYEDVQQIQYAPTAGPTASPQPPPNAEGEAAQAHRGFADAAGTANAPARLRLDRRSVGRLMQDGQPTCTVFLISENQALTAGFCVSNDSNTLAVQFSEGAAINARVVERTGTYSPDKVSYALLRLDREPGANAGWLMLAPERASRETEVAMIGGAMARSISQDCRILDVKSDVFEHNCDVGPGDAGAPILSADGGRVVGLHASRTPKGTYLAVRTDRLIEQSDALSDLTR